MSLAPTISIVDDDDSLRHSLVNLLRSVGFHARGFPSGEAFLGSEDAHETSCVIADVRMPGMSGLALQRHLAGAHRRIPMIFITAHGDEEARARALDAGAVRFLYKPCREDELLSAVHAALEQGGRGGIGRPAKEEHER